MGQMKSSCVSDLARLTNKPPPIYLPIRNMFAGRHTSAVNDARQNGLCWSVLATKHQKSYTQPKSKSVWND